MGQLNNLPASGYVTGTIARPHFEGGFTAYVNVIGDCMAPTILDGSLILINEIKPRHVLEVPAGHPIAFEYGNDKESVLLVKRVAFLNAVNNKILFSCDNPAYRSFWLPFEGIIQMFTIDEIIPPDEKQAFMKRVRPD